MLRRQKTSCPRSFLIILPLLWIVCFRDSAALAQGSDPRMPESPPPVSKQTKEAPSRAQIARDHHVIMQELIDDLKETVDLLQRSPQAVPGPGKEENDARIGALAKRLEELSKRHAALMKMVDDLYYKDTNSKKKPGEDRGFNGGP